MFLNWRNSGGLTRHGGLIEGEIERGVEGEEDGAEEVYGFIVQVGFKF